MPESRTVPLRDIKPYPENPRKITQEAIDAVAESIERYGYQQPIVVDTDMVIVVGHTRYAAMHQLGWKQAEVWITDLPEEKVREYRLIDNRTSELGQWDQSMLIAELREFDRALADRYFPDVNLEIKTILQTQTTDEQVKSATEWALKVEDRETAPTTSVVCPACFHSFAVRTDSLPKAAVADGAPAS